jgi:hypothetical protein
VNGVTRGIVAASLLLDKPVGRSAARWKHRDLARFCVFNNKKEGENRVLIPL